MTIQEQVDADWKAAMKARASEKDALSLIRTELKNKAIETRGAGESGTALNDELALGVLTKMAKQRKESVAEYEKGGREDLAEKERAELAVVEKYLPAGLSEAEVKAIVDEVVAATGASSMKEMGKVMGAVMPKVKGRADGKVIQELVKAALS